MFLFVDFVVNVVRIVGVGIGDGSVGIGGIGSVGVGGVFSNKLHIYWKGKRPD